MFHYMTAITKAAMMGKTAERDMADKRGLAKRKRDRANNTKSPRTRDGKPFPGGKRLRSAHNTLAARVRNFSERADRTKPGSMKS